MTSSYRSRNAGVVDDVTPSNYIWATFVSNHPQAGKNSRIRSIHSFVALLHRDSRGMSFIQVGTIFFFLIIFWPSESGPNVRAHTPTVM